MLPFLGRRAGSFTYKHPSPSRIDDRLFAQKNRALFGMMMDLSSGVTGWECSASRMGCKFESNLTDTRESPQNWK
jgi:hypothetical protein